jgi:hypothetical protein
VEEAASRIDADAASTETLRHLRHHPQPAPRHAEIDGGGADMQAVARPMDASVDLRRAVAGTDVELAEPRARRNLPDQGDGGRVEGQGRGASRIGQRGGQVAHRRRIGRGAVMPGPREGRPGRGMAQREALRRARPSRSRQDEGDEGGAAAQQECASHDSALIGLGAAR